MKSRASTFCLKGVGKMSDFEYKLGDLLGVIGEPKKFAVYGVNSGRYYMTPVPPDAKHPCTIMLDAKLDANKLVKVGEWNFRRNREVEDVS